MYTVFIKASFEERKTIWQLHEVYV